MKCCCETHREHYNISIARISLTNSSYYETEKVATESKEGKRRHR